jgi:AcrR family transcriptional regulator
MTIHSLKGVDMARVTQEHVDARIRAIRDAALRMFAQKGWEGATMQEIASEAGISAGAIYHYYSGKEKLIEDVMTHTLAELRSLMDVSPESGASPTETLLSLYRGAISQLVDDPAGKMLGTVMLEVVLANARSSQGLGAEFRRLAEEGIALLEGLITKAKEKGEIDESLDTHGLALILLAFEEGLHHILGPFVIEEGDAEAILSAFARLLEKLGPSKS